MRMYRSLVVLTLLLAATAIPGSAQENGVIDVSGSWTLTLTTYGEQSSTLIVEQTGESLTLTWEDGQGQGSDLTGSGTITGTDIAWSFTWQTPKGEQNLRFQGTVSGDTMTGESETKGIAVEWKAVRAGAEDATQAPQEISEHLIIPDEVLPVPENLKTGFDSIRAHELHAMLRFLASDALQGRDTGAPGHQVAAEYAASMLARAGLEPAGDVPPTRSSMMSGPRKTNEPPKLTYLQQVELKEIVQSSGSITATWRHGALVKEKTFALDIDYQLRGRESEMLSAPLVFVGYGISEPELGYDEYAGVDADGAIVMMLEGLPAKDDPASPLSEEIRDKYASRRRRSRFARPLQEQVAVEHGAVAIIKFQSMSDRGDVAERILASGQINDEEPLDPGTERHLSLIAASEAMPFTLLPSVKASQQMANEIFELIGESLESLLERIEDGRMPLSMELRGVQLTIRSEISCELLGSPNVLGYVEGSDPELKDEVVVVGAHLDHVGVRRDAIFNGANDNGSGSVVVLELAQAFALNPVKPKRSVLFALWTGEEKGLLGSRYYVQHPVFPLDKTVAVLNLDMVGREWDKERLKFLSRMFGTPLTDTDLEAVDVGKLVTYAFASSDDEIRRAALDNNRYVGMMMLLAEANDEDEKGSGGSDHASFALHGIPWAFFSSGVSEDFHHPSDAIDKTSSTLMEGIARLAYVTAFALADG